MVNKVETARVASVLVLASESGQYKIVLNGPLLSLIKQCQYGNDKSEMTWVDCQLYLFFFEEI